MAFDLGNVLQGSLNPGALGGFRGILGGLAQQSSGGHVQISPQQAQQIPPDQVQDLANRAEQHNSGIFDRLGEFYAQHPVLVKTLGSAALTIALARMANRTRG